MQHCRRRALPEAADSSPAPRRDRHQDLQHRRPAPAGRGTQHRASGCERPRPETPKILLRILFVKLMLRKEFRRKLSKTFFVSQTKSSQFKQPKLGRIVTETSCQRRGRAVSAVAAVAAVAAPCKATDGCDGIRIPLAVRRARPPDHGPLRRNDDRHLLLAEVGRERSEHGANRKIIFCGENAARHEINSLPFTRCVFLLQFFGKIRNKNLIQRNLLYMFYVELWPPSVKFLDTLLEAMRVAVISNPRPGTQVFGSQHLSVLLLL